MKFLLLHPTQENDTKGTKDVTVFLFVVFVVVFTATTTLTTVESENALIRYGSYTSSRLTIDSVANCNIFDMLRGGEIREVMLDFAQKKSNEKKTTRTGRKERE